MHQTKQNGNNLDKMISKLCIPVEKIDYMQTNVTKKSKNLSLKTIIG